MSQYGRDQTGLGLDDITEIALPLPPLREQESIVAYLQNYCAFHNRLVNLIENQSRILSEYRQTIISDAVTGKIQLAQPVGGGT